LRKFIAPIGGHERESWVKDLKKKAQTLTYNRKVGRRGVPHPQKEFEEEVDRIGFWGAGLQFVCRAPCHEPEKDCSISLKNL